MAEGEEQIRQEEEEDDENKPTYRPPAEKSIDEIMKTDQEDESLRKYKETLLGQGSICIDKNNPNKVILQKMSILVDGRPDKEIDLTDVNQLKNMKFIVKEGSKYRLKITFYVQNEIVSGLKFHNKISRVIKVKQDYMAGSYAPKLEPYAYISPEEEFPSGMMARGTYDVHSVFKDDDQNEILKWDWQFEIKKDWAD